jgi:hypothetical protein
MTREQVQKFLDFFGPNGERWTQACMVRNKNGEVMDYSLISCNTDINTVGSACLLGAKRLLFGFPCGFDMSEIPAIIQSGKNAAVWNDHPDRTFEDVRQALLGAVKD